MMHANITLTIGKIDTTPLIYITDKIFLPKLKKYNFEYESRRSPVFRMKMNLD